MLAVYLAQEGRAQAAAPPGQVVFFVRFPKELLPLVYVAIMLLVLNFAISFFTLWRGLHVRRWPWVTTGLAAVLLVVVCAKIGFGNVWGIIDPGSTSSTFRN